MMITEEEFTIYQKTRNIILLFPSRILLIFEGNKKLTEFFLHVHQ